LKNIMDMDYEELKREITEVLGWERYRTDQILDWIYDKKITEFEKMTNLSKKQREILSQNYTIDFPELIDKKVSKIDGTTKFLWKLKDENTIESVLLFHPNRITACISTQVGCPVKCVFCATGMSGFKRNLSAGEIVSQILAMEKETGKKVGNVVYMGMGEPFLNYDEVVKSIRMLNHPKMKNIGIRRITVSTVGIPEKILKFADENLDVTLAFSLHAPSNFKRDKLVPLNRKYSIEEILHALKIYQMKTGRRITVEYIVIKEVNDYPSDAEKLADILKDLKVFVNLIPINPVNRIFKRPSRERLLMFKRILNKKGIEAEIRVEKGIDIEAASGQLRVRKLGLRT